MTLWCFAVRSTRPCKAGARQASAPWWCPSTLLLHLRGPGIASCLAAGCSPMRPISPNPRKTTAHQARPPNSPWLFDLQPPR